MILQLPIWLVADGLAPFAGSFSYDSILAKVTSELASEKDRTSKHCSEIAQHYNLSWVHLTDKNKAVSVSTRPSGLEASSAESSRVVEIKGSRFVEITEPLGKGELLSLGFRCPSLIDSLFSKQIWPGQLPVGTIVVAFLLNALGFLAAYLIFLGIPLGRVLKKLSSGQELSASFPVYVSGELEQITQGIKSRFGSLQETHEKNLSAARSDLSGVFAKEVEDKFITKLAKDLVLLQHSDEVCELIVQRLADEFIGTIKAGFGVEFRADQYRLIHSWGTSEEQSKILAGLAGSRFAALVKKLTSSIALAKDELADKNLEQMLVDLACDQCLVAPIEFSGRIRAHLVFFVANKDMQNAQKLERTIKKLAEQVAPLWLLISNYEEAFHLSRHDFLTGLRNRVYLEEVLKSMKGIPSGDPSRGETVMIMFEGDGFRTMLNSYGPKTIDHLILELSREIMSALEKTVRFKKSSSKIPFSKCVYRVGGCRFLLILEDSNVKKAVELAEVVNQSIVDRKDWPNGMPSWSVSCGVAALNPKESSPSNCFEEAQITLDYVRSRKSTALVVVSSDVPEEFMSRAQARNLGDNTGPFDPVVVLQTVAKAQKTGILTVTSFSGKVFWSFLENGQPVKSRLGGLCGDAAVVEYISTFVDGSYRLQDLSTLDEQTSDDMKNLGGAYVIHTPIKDLIDFSRQSRDSAADAKVHLKTPDMIVHATVEKQAGQIEKVFFKAGKTVNKLYLEVVNAFWEHCNGRYNLEEIISKMSDYPVSLVWSAADFLMQNKLIKFSRLRVSAHTDPERDPTGAAARSAAPAATAPQGGTGFVSTPRACVACRTVDPLSQKYCVHCGAEMVAV